MRLATAVVFLVLLGASTGVCQPTPGAVTGPIQVIAPDLVIRMVTLYPAGTGDPYDDFDVIIANTGNGDAGATTTALVGLYRSFGNVQRLEPGVAGQIATPAIPAGSTRKVRVLVRRDLCTEYMLVVVDSPAPTAPLGAVNESREGNNALALPACQSARKSHLGPIHFH